MVVSLLGSSESLAVCGMGNIHDWSCAGANQLTLDVMWSRYDLPVRHRVDRKGSEHLPMHHITSLFFHAYLAQMVEQLICNQ